MPLLLRFVALGAFVSLSGCSRGDRSSETADTTETGHTTASCSSFTETESAGFVVTSLGAVRGQRQDNGAWSFRGIPFAEPPTGSRRWTAPEPLTCFPDQPLDADALGAKCAQRNLFGQEEGSEDCLTLNVWAPESYRRGDARPTLVYIHGGANTSGSAGDRLDASGALLFDGRHLAADHGAVVVTIQYRLGPFGFLALPELSEENGVAGNYALLDQIAALQWVRDHIDGFGGDPEQVMVFGESAGGYNVCTLLATPAAEGLFSSAIVQSGSCAAETLAVVEAQHSEVVDQIAACQGSDPLLSCLRELPPSVLLGALPGSVELPGSPDDGLTYGAVIDGKLVAQDPLEMLRDGSQNPVPLVVGSNADEMEIPFLIPQDIVDEAGYRDWLEQTTTTWGPKAADTLQGAYPLDAFDSPQDAIAQVLTDLLFTCPARDIVRAFAEGQAGRPEPVPVWRYLFSRRARNASGEVLPAIHTAELRYVFGTLVDGVDPVTPIDESLARSMGARWVGLSASGEPTASVPWPEYELERESYLEFGDSEQVGDKLRNARCDAWATVRGG
ncbi:MAG: carboxylesterase family protein [Myxococcota bacterium]